MSPESVRVGREDLEAKLAEVAATLNAASAPARQAAWRLGMRGAVVGIVAAYFLGRRRGRLSRTFVELRRY